MQNKAKVLSIVGIVLGVCAIVLGVFDCAIVGLVLGVAGVVISLVVVKKATSTEEPTTLAKIGFIVSCVGIAVCVVVLILYIVNKIQKASLFEGAIDAE